MRSSVNERSKSDLSINRDRVLFSLSLLKKYVEIMDLELETGKATQWIAKLERTNGILKCRDKSFYAPS